MPSFPHPPPAARTRGELGADRRPLGASERFFVALRRFTPVNVTRVVALSGELAPTQLARALALLEARHPSLRAFIVDRRRPELAYDAARPLCLHVIEREDDQHFARVLERVLNSQIAREQGRMFGFYYLYAPGTRRAELIVAGEHALCDGISMNQLCCELLALAARPTPIEVRPSLPALDRMLPHFSLRARLEAFSSSLYKLARLSLNRRHDTPCADARSTAFTYVTLSRAETAALIARARAAQTTVTGALLAAVTMTLRELRPQVPALGLSIPINLRPRLPDYALRPEDLANLTSAVYLTSDGRGDLWSLARTLKAELECEAQSERLLAAAPLVYRAGRALIRAQSRPLAHAMLSNSGLVALQRDYGAFRPSAFYSATSAPMLSAELSLFCNTFDGKLTINLLFSPEIVTRELAGRISASLRRRLSAEGQHVPGFFTAA